MKTPNSRISIFSSAVLLAMLFAIANATALTKDPSAGEHITSSRTMATPATASAAPTNLTPTVAVSSPVPPAGEDIRDIRQPRHAHTPWFWVVAAVGVVLLLAALAAAWRWLRHGKYFEMTAAEIALQHLEEARRLMDPDHAREYCFASSKIIRGYLEEQWQLSAPRLTTEEFLRELVEGSEAIATSHRQLLGGFLQHCDLAKFAGWRYSLPALAEMHAGAIEFVKQSSTAPATATPTGNSNPPKPASVPVSEISLSASK